MRFLLDENADLLLADHLRGFGHDVTSITIDYPRSIEDPDVLSIARAEQCILITNDRGVGELMIRKAMSGYGSVRGAEQAAIFATLLATARKSGLNVYELPCRVTGPSLLLGAGMAT